MFINLNNKGRLWSVNNPVQICFRKYVIFSFFSCVNKTI